MEVVLLGVKEIKTGKSYLYDVRSYENDKLTLIEFEFNKKIHLDVIGIYPFEKFTRFVEIDESIYERTTLMAEVNITKLQYAKLKDDREKHYRFENKPCTILRECDTPFQYSLNMLKRFNKRIYIYQLIHSNLSMETKSEKEQLAMCKILNIYFKKNKHLSVNLDDKIIPYLDKFKDLNDKGYKIDYDSNHSYVSTEKLNHINESQLKYLLFDTTIYLSNLIKIDTFTMDFYLSLNNELKKDLMYNFNDGRILEILTKDKKFNIDKLFEDYVYFRENSYEFLDELDYYISQNENATIFDYINDESIKSEMLHYSPLDYYCCEDCDGYDIYEEYTDEELEGEYYYKNYRIDILSYFFGEWKDYISPESFSLVNKVRTDQLNNLLIDAMEKCDYSTKNTDKKYYADSIKLIESIINYRKNNRLC